jgi:hypothetical protein
MSPQCHPAIPLTTTNLSCRRSVKDVTYRRYDADKMTTHDTFGHDPATPRVLSAYGRIFELKGFSGAMFVSCARLVSEHKAKPSAELYIHDAEKTDESGTSAA